MPGHKHFMLYDPPRLRKGMKGLSDADEDDDLEDKHVGWYDLFFDLCLVTGTFVLSLFHLSLYLVHMLTEPQNHLSHSLHKRETPHPRVFFRSKQSQLKHNNSRRKTLRSRGRNLRFSSSRRRRWTFRIESVRCQRQRTRNTRDSGLRLDRVQMLVLRDVDANEKSGWWWSCVQSTLFHLSRLSLHVLGIHRTGRWRGASHKNKIFGWSLLGVRCDRVDVFDFEIHSIGMERTEVHGYGEICDSIQSHYGAYLRCHFFDENLSRDSSHCVSFHGTRGRGRSIFIPCRSKSHVHPEYMNERVGVFLLWCWVRSWQRLWVPMATPRVNSVTTLQAQSWGQLWCLVSGGCISNPYRIRMFTIIPQEQHSPGSHILLFLSPSRFSRISRGRSHCMWHERTRYGYFPWCRVLSTRIDCGCTLLSQGRGCALLLGRSFPFWKLRACDCVHITSKCAARNGRRSS